MPAMPDFSGFKVGLGLGSTCSMAPSPVPSLPQPWPGCCLLVQAIGWVLTVSAVVPLLPACVWLLQAPAMPNVEAPDFSGFKVSSRQQQKQQQAGS